MFIQLGVGETNKITELNHCIPFQRSLNPNSIPSKVSRFFLFVYFFMTKIWKKRILQITLQI